MKIEEAPEIHKVTEGSDAEKYKRKNNGDCNKDDTFAVKDSAATMLCHGGTLR